MTACAARPSSKIEINLKKSKGPDIGAFFNPVVQFIDDVARKCEELG
jgi:hypothetical protein